MDENENGKDRTPQILVIGVGGAGCREKRKCCCVVMLLACAVLSACSGRMGIPAIGRYSYVDTALLCERFPEADSMYYASVNVDIELPVGRKWQNFRNELVDIDSLDRYAHHYVEKYFEGAEYFLNEGDSALYCWILEHQDSGMFMPPYKHFICYRRFTSEYGGGAHGLEWEKYWCFDRRNCHQMSRTDFIGAEYDGDLSVMLLEAALSDKTIHLFGGGTPIEPSDNFYVTENGITYVYPLYEIAPYSSGIVHITLPWCKIDALLKQ